MSIGIRILTVATVIFAAPLVTRSLAAPPAAATEGAELQTYIAPQGAGYFALALKPSVKAPAAVSAAVLVLADTSASQTGEYRRQMMAALGAMLSALTPEDKVKLVAVDLDASPLSQQFASTTSNDVQVALASLRRRVPLGSTDMMKALKIAAASFPPSKTTRQSVIYLGDGMSRANLLGSAEFGKLVGELASRKIAFSSYAVGPHVDGELLAVLANQTGGRVLVDGAEVDAAQAGAALASIARAPVFWPTQAQWPQTLAVVYPVRTPPLRMDRDTIVLGRGTPAGGQRISLTANLDGQVVTLNWKMPAAKPDDANNYLVSLAKMAAADGGATLPTAGSAGLLEARRMIATNAADLIRLSQHSLSMQNYAAAERLAQRALAIDPESVEAQTLADAAHQAQTRTLPAAAPVHRAAAGAAGADSDLPLQIPRSQEDQIDKTQQRIVLNTKVVQAEVQQSLRKAGQQMGTDPAAVENELRLMLDAVRANQDILPQVKAQLVDQLQNTIRQAGRQGIILNEAKRRKEEAAASGRERQALIDNVGRKEERLKQLMDRFESLMQEGRYIEADQQVAAEAKTLAPDSAEVRSATTVAQLTGAAEDQRRLYDQRCKALVATFFEVEKSYVPSPDDPPIVYPAPDAWEDLTIRRRKYSSVDLHQSSPAERKINEQLKKTTKMDFDQTRLDEVMSYIQELHGITIALDNNALQAINITGENLVTLNVQGISLRSALRLLMRSIDPTLTYSIQNEVLMITTKEAAQEHMVTKVYPVGDLAVPISYDFAGDGGFSGFGSGAFGAGRQGGGFVNPNDGGQGQNGQNPFGQQNGLINNGGFGPQGFR